MITASQMRAARALLRWPANELARAAGLSVPTIQRMESGTGVPGGLARNVQAIRRALEKAGVEFIDENGGGQGVRLREPE